MKYNKKKKHCSTPKVEFFFSSHTNIHRPLLVHNSIQKHCNELTNEVREEIFPPQYILIFFLEERLKKQHLYK